MLRVPTLLGRYNQYGYNKGSALWYNSPVLRAQAEDGSVVYPSWILDGANQRYAKSTAPAGPVSQVTFSGLLENFTRASDATYFDASGTLRTATTNEPRFTYDHATLQPLGLLIEEARTNLVTWSDDFTQGRFNLFNSGTVMANQRAAPDDTVTVDKLENTSAGNWYYGRNITLADNTTYVYTVWCALEDGNTGLSLRAQQNGGAFPVYGSQTVTQEISSGLVRAQLVFTKPADGSQARIGLQLAAGQAGYVWGEMLEASSTATSYIPTAGSTVTRAADNVFTDALEWYRSSEGTFVVEGLVPSTGFLLVFGQGATGSAPRGHIINTSSQVQLFMADNSVTRNVNGSNFSALGTNSKISSTFDASYINLAKDGILATSSVGLTVPSTITRMAVGRRYGLANSYYSGAIKSIIYYPKRLTDSELQRLTM